MYPEFWGIYACLVIIIILLITVIWMLRANIKKNQENMKYIGRSETEYGGQGGSVVCVECMQVYSADLKQCPRCGKRR